MYSYNTPGTLYRIVKIMLSSAETSQIRTDGILSVWAYHVMNWYVLCYISLLYVNIKLFLFLPLLNYDQWAYIRDCIITDICPSSL